MQNTASSMPSCGSPTWVKRAGMAAIVKSAGGPLHRSRPTARVPRLARPGHLEETTQRRSRGRGRSGCSR
jgi:hypothetical protein